MMKLTGKILALPVTIVFLFGCSDNDETGSANTAPIISDQTFSIAEDASIGTSVGTLVASDADEDPLTFSIIDGNPGDIFSIDNTSGELALSGTLNFDITTSYALTVQVADEESDAKATITVNVAEAENAESKLMEKTITFDGMEREYLLYIPAGYTGDNVVPLLFSLHGAGGTKESQFELSQFNELADSENFILVTPEGENRVWNQASSSMGADDVGFINALMDEIISEYNIDDKRMYVAGSSNGAFMALQLACQLNDRVAAVAAVKGYMLAGQIEDCKATRPIAIIQMHGTEDPLVSYGNVDTTIQFWLNFNQTETTAVVTNLPDIDPDNENTVVSYLYQNGTDGVEVEHLQVIGGSHHWFGEPGTNYDISASSEAWRFLSKFDINGLR